MTSLSLLSYWSSSLSQCLELGIWLCWHHCMWLSFLRLPILKRETCLVFNVNFWILINTTVSLQIFYWSLLLLKSKALVVLFYKSFKYSWINAMCSYEEIFVSQIDMKWAVSYLLKGWINFCFLEVVILALITCFSVYTIHCNWKKHRAVLPMWHISWLKSGMFSLIKL